MKTRSWFRVTVNEVGKVIDCKPVSSEGSDQLGVYFFRTSSAAAAGKLASGAHAARLLAARRARYTAAGLCKCGRERDRGSFKTCSACDERHKIHVKRKQARARGEEVPPLDRRTVLRERKQSELDTARFETLLDVQRVLARQGVDGLKRWLGSQIERHTKKPMEAA